MKRGLGGYGRYVQSRCFLLRSFAAPQGILKLSLGGYRRQVVLVDARESGVLKIASLSPGSGRAPSKGSSYGGAAFRAACGSTVTTEFGIVFEFPVLPAT